MAAIPVKIKIVLNPYKASGFLEKYSPLHLVQ